MTPEQLDQFNKMLAQVAEIYAWMLERQRQALPYPIDDTSRKILELVSVPSTGTSALTQSITIGAGGGSANVPKAYGGTIIVVADDGTKYEVPYIRTVS